MRAELAVVVVATGLATALAGCGGGAAPPRRAIGSVPSTSGPLVATAGATAIAPAGGLERALAAMPADYELVLAVDATQVRASKLYASHEAWLRGLLEGPLAALDRGCGLDPLTALTGVLIGGKGYDLQSATIFLTGVDGTAAADCARRLAARDREDGGDATVVVDGDYLAYRSVDDLDALLALPPRTLLWRRNDRNPVTEPMALRVAAVGRPGEGLTGSPTFRDLLERTGTGRAFWFIIRGDGSPGSLASMVSARAIRGAFDLDDRMTGTVRVTLDSAAAATRLADELRRQLDQVGQTPFGAIVSDTTITTDDVDVVVSVELSSDQLDGLIALFRGVLP